jgi:hypothetical protein
VIDEYAINFRSIIWLYPPVDPTKADKAAEIIIKFMLLNIVNKIKGIIFCDVNNIVRVNQEIPSDTDGNH